MRNVSLAVRKRHKKERLQTAPLVLLSHLLNEGKALPRSHLCDFAAEFLTLFCCPRRRIEDIEVQAANLAAIYVTAANALAEDIYLLVGKVGYLL